nr:hypothetical protein [Candidatus Sigynarchaeota archaeon]
MIRKIKAFMSGIIAGWCGVGLLVTWAFLKWGDNVWLGEDSWWILSLAGTLIVLFVAWGVRYLLFIKRLMVQGHQGVSNDLKIRAAPALLLVLSVGFLVAGSTVNVAPVITYQIAQFRYNQVHALLENPSWVGDGNRTLRRDSIRGVMADSDFQFAVPDYWLPGGPPYHFNITTLVKHCEALGINCFHFLIFNYTTEWPDFQDFIIAAEQSAILLARNFTTWLYLLPPSETDGTGYAPIGRDYIQWMNVSAQFSKLHPIFTAVLMDDFMAGADNRNLFTGAYLQQMRDAADAYDPSLAFVGCNYWDEVNPSLQPEIWNVAVQIGPYLDGILYPYVDASSHAWNLIHTDSMCTEIARVKEIYPGIPVILDIYASGPTMIQEKPNATYVGTLMDSARTCCDGMALYGGPKMGQNGTVLPST